MKSDEEIMEILEAFDLCGSFRAAAQLAGCDHHTVARYVEARSQGTPARQQSRDRLTDPYLAKIAEWVERSKGRVRADIAHEKLLALGFEGSERSTRRAVAEAKQLFQDGHRRLYRPWVAEPGMWLQWDFGKGPQIAGKDTWLWCSWLAWSRFRVVIPVWDRTLPTVIASIDRTLRNFGGAPTYALTDNEKTVTALHVAGIAVRHPELAAAARYYGMTVATCVPADPESKGGVEATVRIAKADVLPTDFNLLPAYQDFAQLERACQAWCEQVNSRPHRETSRPPIELLEAERAKLHQIPTEPFTLALGVTRRVTWSSTISFGGVRYSVPYRLAGGVVWVRMEGEQLVAVAVDPRTGAAEVARHRLSTPGNPQILPEHYPPRAAEGAVDRTPKARNQAEKQFLALGDGARQWLVEAAAAGAQRVPGKMAKALALSKLHGRQAVDRALGTAAIASRFADADLESIIEHQRLEGDAASQQASEQHSLQPGTSAWNGFGK